MTFLNQLQRLPCTRFNLNLEKCSFLQMISFLLVVAFKDYIALLLY